ncbi:hypothetical protein ACLB2K_018220 [Fragaria x ananassa]
MGLRAGWRGFSLQHRLVQGYVLVFHKVETQKVPRCISNGVDTQTTAFNSPTSSELSEDLLYIMGDHDEGSTEGGDVSSYIDGFEDNSDCVLLEGPGLPESAATPLKEVTCFDKFKVMFNGRNINSQIPKVVLKKYYELCSSQSSHLHQHVVESLNSHLVVGLITGTVNIADAVKSCKIATKECEFQTWEKTLEASEILGMNVGFLRIRVRRLASLAAESLQRKKERMEEEKIQKFIQDYFKNRGLKLPEELEQSSTNTVSSPVSQFDPDVVRQILAFSQFQDGPARYQDEYAKLRSWTYTSLDLYRHELLRVLYPVFIHCFMDLVAKGHIQEARTFFSSFREDHEMMHLRDLQKLEGVLSPSHLEEMEFAHSLRQSKVNITICQYSYELLLQFLHKSQSTTMLGIINEHINFQVSPGQPSSITDDAEAVTLTGGSQESANQINQKEIHWGLLEDSLEERLEKAGGMALDSERAEGETKEGDGDENKKKSIEGGKQGASIKKQKKDKAVSATMKSARPEATPVPTAPRVKPELTLPVIPTEVEQSILEDLRNRVQLSSAALPSVSFYTFINTHNGLNCSSISLDGSLVAGGFSDSSLKVWDMAKIGQQSVGYTVVDYKFILKMLVSDLQGENGTASSEQVAGSNGGKRPYTLFQGHSGPVYSATFNPLGDFILSSSADSTIRLWSTDLNANLVCYKGHNYPVWDVQCVQWHSNCNYIATGSSDKTVRLWDVQSGECVRIFIGHRSMILSLAMSPDGRYMASGDEDGSIMMWDLSTGRCVTPLMGHTSCVWTLAFSGEGSLLASGSADCTVKLWDITASTKLPKAEENRSGSASRLRSLKTLPTKSTPVYSLRFSRRNLLFAAGVLSKSV